MRAGSLCARGVCTIAGHVSHLAARASLRRQVISARCAPAGLRPRGMCDGGRCPSGRGQIVRCNYFRRRENGGGHPCSNVAGDRWKVCHRPRRRAMKFAPALRAALQLRLRAGETVGGSGCPDNVRVSMR